MEQDRRRFLRSSAIALSAAAGGDLLCLHPSAAYAADLPHRVLSATQAGTLQALAEAIVPGARQVGISHYIDMQLAAAPQDSLLMLKYLGVAAQDFTDFYRSGLDSAARLARSRFGRPWPSLDTSESANLLADIAGDTAGDWRGPPASFFFFVVRSDACDVLYGTRAGFDRLEIPYMAHIAPEQDW